ncbi:hypothetical protein [Streptomyces klenkii]|uniref:hypothetical protein n=1 Tax=Streptomyces klenkii TaxID=1420899 RepID=UPI003421E3F9
MSDKLIVPMGIPQFTGDLAELEKNAASLAKDAKAFRDAGAAVHSTFQGLSAHYKAPEADQLFATTAPVATKSDGFADGLEKVASALNAYRAEIQPLKTKLENLKTEALRFVASVDGDDDWRKDQKKVDHNNDLWHDVNAAVDAFNAAERACHDKIVALVGGKSLIPDDGSHKPNMYGYKASDLDHAEETPWGALAEREYTGLAWLGHQIKSFVWDGFIVDGVWGTVKGLGTLVGTDGWKAAGQAWTGLAKLATGIVITAVPVAGAALWSTPDDKLPSWLRDSRTAMKETGKALIAYDQWGKNPARAAGAVSFNVLTTVFTGGSGAAAKGGAAAKAISVAARTGRYLDATTYVGVAGKFGLTKVGDMMSTLKNLRGSGASLRIADESFKLADQAPPVRPAGLPDSVSPLMGDKGKVVWVDEKTGALFNEHGKTLQPAHEVPKEPSAAERAAAPEKAPEKAEVMAGVSARTNSEATAALGHLDDNVPGGAASHTPGGTSGHVPDGTAREASGSPRNHAPDGPGSHPSESPASHRPAGSSDDLGRGPSPHNDPPTGPRDPSTPHGGGRDANSHGSDHPHRGNESALSDHSRDGAGPAGHADDSHTSPGAGDHAETERTQDASQGGTPNGGRSEESGSPERYSEGERRAYPPTGAMRAEQEPALVEALDRAKMQPQDQQRLLVQLRKSPYGSGVAEHIVGGRLAGMPEYRELLNQSKQKGMIPAVYQAMEFAEELRSSGVKGLEFEYKDPAAKLDLDVLTRVDGKIGYGWQLKEVEGADGIKSAVKGIAKKQLVGTGVEHKVAILDIQDVKSALTGETLKDVEYYSRKLNATFELRFQDGSITIPANGRARP